MDAANVRRSCNHFCNCLRTAVFDGRIFATVSKMLANSYVCAMSSTRHWRTNVSASSTHTMLRPASMYVAKYTSTSCGRSSLERRRRTRMTRCILRLVSSLGLKAA